MPEEQTTNTDVRPIFGVQIALGEGDNRVLIPLETSSLDKIKENGVKFALTEEVPLPTAEDILVFVDSNFETNLAGTLRDDVKALPKFIQDVVNSLTEAQLIVRRASIRVPGTESSDPTTYTLVFAMEFPDAGFPLTPGLDLVFIKGGMAGITNDPNYGKNT